MPTYYTGLCFLPLTNNLSPSQSPSLYPSHKGHCLEWRARADMPVRMKGLQAVLLNGRVLVGGGYTGNMHTEMTVYDYDPIFDMWAELPKAPTRWFGIAEFKGQLVLVGGKEAEGRGMKMTNRIAAYDDRKKEWLQPYPPMSAARSQPFVFSHAHLLAVAGGRKGILDFHVEILNGHSRQWSQATPLPAPCSPSTSLVHNGRWYLLGGRAHIHHASLEDYLTDHLRAEGGGEGGGGVGEGTGLATASTIESRDIRQGDRGHTPFWDELDPPPFTAARILSVGRHVTAFPSPTEGAGAGSTQVHQFLGSQEGWVHVGKLPSVCGSASPVRLSRGELLLFGGDVDGLHYSNKAYRVTVGCAGAQCKKRATFAA